MYYIHPKGLEYGVYHIPSKGWVPNDPTNSDWQNYLAWVEAGNVAEPFPVEGE